MELGGPGYVTYEAMAAGVPLALLPDGTYIPSIPILGNFPLINIQVINGVLHVEYDTSSSIDMHRIVSIPGAGGRKVVNLFVDATTNKLTIEYED